jgi:UDP:flavonoid glycosyltransferase YjiC (YdhE family)
MSNFVLPLAEKVVGIVRKACKDADAIIHSFLLTSLGFEFAREKDIPDISAQLFPVFTNTSEFASPAFPNLPFGDSYRQLSHQAVSQIFWQGSRHLYRRVRKDYPFLPALTRWPFDERYPRVTPILYAFSPHVVPRPKDWKAPAFITGYWFSKTIGNWIPDENLIDFLDSGPPPIAIAFGSTNASKLNSVVEKIVAALNITRQRGIIVGYQQKEISQGIYQIGSVPYSWLFERSSAIIHHGGAGTTGKGLMAGVPNIVIPFTSDQPFWANRVHALGVGPKPISPKRLTTQQLVGAIATAMEDEEMRKRAALMGEALRVEEGVSRAVDIIQKIVKKKTKG